MGAKNDKKPDPVADELLARIEKQLDDIEIAELLQDMSEDVLAEKGFIGDKAVSTGRSVADNVTEKEHLVFKPGVTFERLGDTISFDSIEFGQVAHIVDVNKGQLIAIRNSSESGNFDAGDNVSTEVIEGRTEFRAMLRGKPVIIKDALYIFPSDINCKIDIKIDPDKMHAFLNCVPAHADGVKLSVEGVLAELDRLGVTHGIKKEVITTIVADSNETKSSGKDVLIAEGTKPVPEKAGTVQYTFDTRPKEYDFRILPDGRIDYRSTKGILTAEVNQLLAKISPVTPGVNGYTVCGDSIPPEAPTDTDVPIFPGKGIWVSQNGREFYAAIPGCIIVNGPVLDVVNTYVVDGDVDYATGNIIFNGNVVVCGTVIDGFEIRAEGDVVVSKIVESAKIVAGRDIIVKGGILGRGKGLISAGRDIRTGFAQNARLEAQGNIYIKNYAVNSYLATTGQLIMLEQRGSVMGGEVYALKGLDVRSIGSENGIKTCIEAGTDYLTLRTTGEMDAVITFCETNIRKINEALKSLGARFSPDEPIPAAMQKPMVKAVDKKRDLERRMAMIQAKKAALIKMSRVKDRCFVKVKDTCFPDVHITIKDLTTIVAVARQRVRYYDDPKQKEIGVGAY